MTDFRTSDRAGFTLVEAVVALAILAGSLAVLFPLMADLSGRSDKAALTKMSVMIAESKLAEIGTLSPLSEGTNEGVVGDAYRWRSAVVYRTDYLQRTPYEVGIYEVRVSVSARGHNDLVVLQTLRLGPKPDAN